MIFISLIEKIKDSQQIQTENVLAIDNEIDAYSKQSFNFSNENEDELKSCGPLYFFKVYAANYHYLKKVAKAIFSIPATSVPSEALFSQVGYIQKI